MEDSLQLNLEILAEQGIALIRCRGQLKFGKEAQLLKKCVDSVLSQFSICVLSLSAIHQIDARGLGTLVAIQCSKFMTRSSMPCKHVDRPHEELARAI